MWVVFCLNTGKRLFLEVSFGNQKKEHKFFLKMLPGILKIAICLRDQHFFIWQSMESLNVFNILTFQYWNRFSAKRQPFWKNWSTVFYLKALRLKTHHFHTKLSYQKPKLRQIEWWVQNGPVTLNGVLSAATLFF